jgi:hypothetical protein
MSTRREWSKYEVWILAPGTTEGKSLVHVPAGKNTVIRP